MPSEENFEIPPAHPPTHQPLRSRTHLPPGTPARNPRGAAGPRLAPRACSRTRCTSPPPRLTRPFYPFGHWIRSLAFQTEKASHFPSGSHPLLGSSLRQEGASWPGSWFPAPPAPTAPPGRAYRGPRSADPDSPISLAPSTTRRLFLETSPLLWPRPPHAFLPVSVVCVWLTDLLFAPTRAVSRSTQMASSQPSSGPSLTSVRRRLAEYMRGPDLAPHLQSHVHAGAKVTSPTPRKAGSPGRLRRGRPSHAGP